MPKKLKDWDKYEFTKNNRNHIVVAADKLWFIHWLAFISADLISTIGLVAREIVKELI